MACPIYSCPIEGRFGWQIFRHQFRPSNIPPVHQIPRQISKISLSISPIIASYFFAGKRKAKGLGKVKRKPTKKVKTTG